MKHVFKLMRVLLVLPILTAFLGFASLDFQERTEVDGMQVVAVDVGVWPWFHYENYRSHDGPTGFVMSLASEAESSPRSYTSGYRWSFDLATWSVLCGGVFLILSWIYFRLGRAITRTRPVVTAPPAAPAGP